MEKDGTPRLTKREEEILNLCAKGYTNAQIALALGISPKTVATYMSRVCLKLQVNNRTAAVAVYLFHKSTKGIPY